MKTWEKELEDIACWEVCCAGLPPEHTMEETQYDKLKDFFFKTLATELSEYKKGLRKEIEGRKIYRANGIEIERELAYNQTIDDILKLLK